MRSGVHIRGCTLGNTRTHTHSPGCLDLCRTRLKWFLNYITPLLKKYNNGKILYSEFSYQSWSFFDHYLNSRRRITALSFKRNAENIKSPLVFINIWKVSTTLTGLVLMYEGELSEGALSTPRTGLCSGVATRHPSCFLFPHSALFVWIYVILAHSGQRQFNLLFYPRRFSFVMWCM